MFSKVLVKLTCVFLIISISITSATPARAVVKAQNTNDDTQALAPHGNYPQYLCKFPFIWRQRECTADLRGWQDVCVKTLDHASTEKMKPEVNHIPGACAGDYLCFDTSKYTGNKENEYVNFVACLSEQNGKGQQAIDAQAGRSEKMWASIEYATAQKIYSVTIDHDMTHATVSAVLYDCELSHY